MRNALGLKDTMYCYRTFNGAEYVGWMAYVSKDRMAAYRAAGVRVRKVGSDVFVHHMDKDEALRVDDAVERTH